MKRPAFVPAFSFIAMMLFSVACSADTGMEMTTGPGSYSRRDLFFSAAVSKPLRLGFNYSQYTSSFSSTVFPSYSFSASARPWRPVDLGVSVSFSPETDGSRSSGFGLNGGYHGYKGVFDWSVSVLVTGNTYSEKSDAAVDGWTDLYQTSFEPRAQARFFDRIGVSAGVGTYSYSDDIDQAGRSSRKFQPLTVAAGPSLDGYPKNYRTIGMSFSPSRGLVFSGDWSHTAYMLHQPSESAGAYGVSYLFLKTFEARGTYTIVNNGDTYTGIGGAWFW